MAAVAPNHDKGFHDEPDSFRGNTSTPGERAWALFRVMKEKNLIPDGYIENLTELMSTTWDPANGARIVARAWVDPAFRELLLTDGTAACAQFGYTGPQGEYIVALEDTPTLKNVIVCSLCSCTNWPVLGCRPSGTRASNIVHGSSAKGARYCGNSAPSCPTTSS